MNLKRYNEYRINENEGNESILHDDPYWEISVIEFNGNINEEFSSFVKSSIQSYDDSKHETFWLESDTI